MAFELAQTGMDVICDCPEYVSTPMQAWELDWEVELRGTTPGSVERMWIDATPLGRIERSEYVAMAGPFLLFGDAEFITGEVLAVTEGTHMD